MGNRWTPRKHLLRRFKSAHGHLDEFHNAIEEIKQAHEGRNEESDLYQFLEIVQNRTAELDMLLEAANHRFKTGRWPEIPNGDAATSSPGSLEGSVESGQGQAEPPRDREGRDSPTGPAVGIIGP